jgi:hypothetical protein
MDTHAKVSVEYGPPILDMTQLRSLVGALQYLMFTRPDIIYVIQQVCLHMHYRILHILHYMWSSTSPP